MVNKDLPVHGALQFTWHSSDRAHVSASRLGGPDAVDALVWPEHEVIDTVRGFALKFEDSSTKLFVMYWSRYNDEGDVIARRYAEHNKSNGINLTVDLTS